MSSSITADVRTPEVLNVAVATDTILYTPFFVAYHSGDFENTPFCKLSVNIIGSEDDARFVQSRKLKGDGFATFCLLLGLADAAICDPSFYVYLKEKKGVLESEFEKFETLLTDSTKGTLAKNPKYADILDYNNAKLDLKNIDAFKKLFFDKKVIGRMISKIAFSVVGSADLEEIAASPQYKGNDNFGKTHKKDANRKPFTEHEVTGKFIYYDKPSTGYCIGQIHSSIYKKKHIELKDFGQELKILKEPGYKKSVAFTCDFVSLDYELNRKDAQGQPKIIEIENFAEDETKNYMFTGILGNCQVKNTEKLQALLYGIDKNLYAINNFLKGSDTTGLTKYFKRKFNYSDNKLSGLLTLLVADEECKKAINQNILDNGIPDFTFDTIIRYYVDRLYRCNKYGGLYFNTTTPDTESLRNMTELRYEAASDKENENKTVYEDFIEMDMLLEWRKEKEAKYFSYQQQANNIRRQEKSYYALLLFLTPFLYMTRKRRDALKARLWLYASYPSYLYNVGSIFLTFEVVTGMCHIFGIHINPESDFKLSIGFTSKGTFYGFNAHIAYFQWLFVYLNLTIIVLIFLSRNLMKLKENDKYVYRNEFEPE